MKISERKQRLRARGWVPVPQETVREQGGKKSAVVVTRGGDKAATTRKGAPPPARKPRWQPSSGYQITFGIAYIIFAPILFVQSWSLLHAPHSKAHPGLLEFGMPVVFFLFGLWWVYRGLKARRLKAQTVAPLTETVTTTRKPRRRGTVTDNEVGVR